MIEQPASARILVDAAAGTGKTHTLVGRLAKLVEQDGLSVGGELLVLSFSRAAVAELRRRTVHLGSDARFVGAATFDSFATSLLADGGSSVFLQEADYDQRIRLAVARLSEEGDLPVLSAVRHILIDEVQDLVGCRADLVKALLGRIACGFTLLGDPAQAIYDYQDIASQHGTTTAWLYDWLHKTFEESLVRASLHTNYRATSEQVRRVALLGERLRVVEPDQSGISDDIRTLVLGLPLSTAGTARRLLDDAESRSAVLSRTNGEALWISRTLDDNRIKHRLQRRGQDKAAAGWLSEIVAGVDSLRMTRPLIEERLAAITERQGLRPESCMRLLRLLDPRRGSDFDLRRIADRVRLGDIPEDLNAVGPQGVVVSTIHRAKGLEFDRVLLHGRFPAELGNDRGLENRVAYVALTRAREELWYLDTPEPRGLRMDPASRRWVRKGFGPNAWQIYNIEVVGTDVHAVHPAGAWLVEADVADTQAYIRAAVMPGDSVRLEILDVDNADDLVHYGIFHDDRLVGVTSDTFARALTRALATRSSPRWPRRIDGIRVDIVDTVAGHESVGRNTGLGSHGMWARVRVAGLGSLALGEGN